MCLSNALGVPSARVELTQSRRPRHPPKCTFIAMGTVGPPPPFAPSGLPGERFCPRLQLRVSRTGLQRIPFNKFMAHCFPRWITQSSTPRCQSLCKASCRWFSWLPPALLTRPDLLWTSLSPLLPSSWATGGWGVDFSTFSLFLSLFSLSLSLSTFLFQVNFLISSKPHAPCCPYFQSRSQLCISQG